MNRATAKNGARILVVGGAGYIGSQVNKSVHQHGYDTIVFDNLSRGHAKNVQHGQLIKGDISNCSDLENLFGSHRFTAIMHFAALTDIGESVQNPLMYYQNNIANTLNLIRYAVKYSIKAFIFSSSAAIFGMPQTSLIDETHPCSPINPYGYTKLMIEQILRDCDNAYGLKSCCLRYFNAAGGDPEGKIKLYERKENNLIPLLLKNILNPSFKVTLFGTDYPTPDGTCIRDYIHVHDLAEAHVKGLERLLTTQSSSAYNLGNGNGFSVREVIESVQRVTGKKLIFNEGPRRPGDPAILVANAVKATQELGWKPIYPDLDTMVAHAYKASCEKK